MRLKCKATGKTIFSDANEAKEKMVCLKNAVYIKADEGRHRKHRIGKPAWKRAYLCPYCNGYHLTSLRFYCATTALDGLAAAINKHLIIPFKTGEAENLRETSRQLLFTY